MRERTLAYLHLRIQIFDSLNRSIIALPPATSSPSGSTTPATRTSADYNGVTTQNRVGTPWHAQDRSTHLWTVPFSAMGAAATRAAKDGGGAGFEGSRTISIFIGRSVGYQEKKVKEDVKEEAVMKERIKI